MMKKKYGAIKDNVFSLLQGADARVKALDSLKQLEQQQNLMKAIAVKMKKYDGRNRRRISVCYERYR